MKPSSNSNSVAIPPALLAEIQAAAKEERRAPSEVMKDAIEHYLQIRRLQRLYAYGEERARSLGLTEADIPRLIAEARQEQQR